MEIRTADHYEAVAAAIRGDIDRSWSPSAQDIGKQLLDPYDRPFGNGGSILRRGTSRPDYDAKVVEHQGKLSIEVQAPVDWLDDRIEREDISHYQIVRLTPDDANTHRCSLGFVPVAFSETKRADAESRREFIDRQNSRRQALMELQDEIDHAVRMAGEATKGRERGSEQDVVYKEFKDLRAKWFEEISAKGTPYTMARHIGDIDKARKMLAEMMSKHGLAGYKGEDEEVAAT